MSSSTVLCTPMFSSFCVDEYENRPIAVLVAFLTIVSIVFLFAFVSRRYRAE